MVELLDVIVPTPPLTCALSPPRQVLDVFELDRLAGYYLEKKLANFHVPPRASAQAALALLLQLRLGVGATRGEHSRKATSARAPM